MSDNESSDRPRPRYGEYAEKKPARPQFGEYASPEEQRAAIRVPATEDNESVPIESHGDEKKASEHVDRLHPHMPTNRHPEAKPTTADDDPVTEARRRTDRFSTFLLLGVGLISVLSTAPSLLQLPQMLTQAYKQFGIDGYTNTSLGTTIGWVILIVYAALWVLALLLSLRRLAARKRTWWVPFVIGVVANLLYMILLTVAMVSDPAFMQYVNGMAG